MIDRFDGKYAFLSNFYSSPITIRGKVYPTVEHAFQAWKTKDLVEREKIRLAATPGIAKRMGRRVQLRYDWEVIKLDLMLWLLQRKFRDSTLASMLLETGDNELVEGNYWKDTFWGVCNGIGQNHLGRLLMQVREEIRQQQECEK